MILDEDFWKFIWSLERRRNKFSKVFVQIIQTPPKTPLKPHGFRPLWNHPETTRFQTTLKPHGFRPLWNHSETTRLQTTETTLKPRGFRPLWNHSETTRFQTTLKPVWNHTVSDPSETTLKPFWNHSETPLKPSLDGLDGRGWKNRSFRFQTGFKLVWNHLFSPRERVKKRRMRQNESWAQFSGHFRDPLKRKKNPVFDTRPSFSLRGAPDQKKLQKNPQFLTLDSRIPAEGCSKIQKSQKPLSFWHSTRSFEGLHRARFSWLLGCTK